MKTIIMETFVFFLGGFGLGFFVASYVCRKMVEISNAVQEENERLRRRIQLIGERRLDGPES